MNDTFGGFKVDNQSYYKIASCPICKQGYLEIVKELKTGKIFICCDECEIEWETPEEAIEGKNGSRFKYGKVIEPTMNEIYTLSWEKFIQSN